MPTRMPHDTCCPACPLPPSTSPASSRCHHPSLWSWRLPSSLPYSLVPSSFHTSHSPPAHFLACGSRLLPSSLPYSLVVSSSHLTSPASLLSHMHLCLPSGLPPSSPPYSLVPSSFHTSRPPPARFHVLAACRLHHFPIRLFRVPSTVDQPHIPCWLALSHARPPWPAAAFVTSLFTWPEFPPPSLAAYFTLYRYIGWFPPTSCYIGLFLCTSCCILYRSAHVVITLTCAWLWCLQYIMFLCVFWAWNEQDWSWLSEKLMCLCDVLVMYPQCVNP